MTDRPVQTLLNVREATAFFGTRRVLAGVNFELRRGEIYALLGPNGAGKTSLIRAICGRVRLDEGGVVMLGGDPRTEPSVRRRLGLVPQSIALYPHLTARENLEVLGRLSGVATGNLSARVRDALAWAGLDGRADDRVDRLSGGMQRRLNMAAGTLHEPDVLLLDEPTVGVDVSAGDLLHQLVRNLRDQGMAILLTTHDMLQAEDLADRIGIMVDGAIVAEGALADLVRRGFGADKELTIALPREPAEGGRALLNSLGLQRGARGRIWRGRWSKGLAALPGLEQDIARAGIEIAELVLREPGLRSVYFQTTGQEFDA